MARPGDDYPMSDADPVEQPEPGRGGGSGAETREIWLRGLAMLVLGLGFALAETVLGFCALFQFVWLLVKRRPNPHVAAFGLSLSRWLADVARFQTGATEDKPFPWARWRG